MRLNTSVSSSDVGFQSAIVSIRPRRVAIVIRSDERWRDWAMTALATASDYWGGAGYILVPFDPATGKASSSFAEVVRAYDPDHVATLSIPWATWEQWYPGAIQTEGIEGAERARLMETSKRTLSDGGASIAARDEVASWCSPMRSERLPGQARKRAHEPVRTISRRRQDDRMVGGMAPAPPPLPGARLAAALHWRSDAGMLAAMRLGVAGSEPRERPEPADDVIDWLVRREGEAPVSLIWSNDPFPPVSAAGLEPWFLGGQEIMSLGRGYIQDRVAVVVGDKLEDFALALAYDRLIGAGVWLPTALLDDAAKFQGIVKPLMWTTIMELERGANTMVVTSNSMSDGYVTDIAARIQSPLYETDLTIDGRPVSDDPDESTVAVRAARLDQGLFTYVSNEHGVDAVSLPMANLPDGSVEALAGLETPIPGKLLYPPNSGWVPYWFVDVSLDGDLTPRGRDLPGHSVAGGKGLAYPSVHARSSRDGITFDPRSMGFIAAGAMLVSRIDRPLVRGLSMRAWVEAMARADGLGVRLSFPGRQAELVQNRLGSRMELLGLVSGGALPMLQAFVPRTRQPRPSERDPEIVVVGLDSYLSFNAIQELLPGSTEDAMNMVDTLISSRLLRRGLVLGCGECGRLSFVDADRLGQQFECPQCATLNGLVSDRWHREAAEPRWFYDLYATFRDLLAKRGDVVLLAAANLQGNSPSYMDTPELEFFDLDTEEPVAEIDVIASAGGEVVIVEAKAGGAFPGKQRGTQTRKLLRVAKALRADRIQLATTSLNWNEGDVTHLSSEAGLVNPFPVAVDVVTSLE
jgi:hypothetical protein